MADLTHALTIFNAVEEDVQALYQAMMDRAEAQGLTGAALALATLQAGVMGCALFAAATRVVDGSFLPVSTAIDAAIAAWPEAERMLDEAMKQAAQLEAGHA